MHNGSHQTRFFKSAGLLKGLLFFYLLLASLMLNSQLVSVLAVYGSPGSVQALFDPLTVLDPSLGPGDQFSIDLTAENVENLFGYQFWLSFDPTILEGVSVENGPFLGSEGATVVVAPGAGFWYDPDDAHYAELKLFGAQMFFMGEPPPDTQLPDGDGVLATVTFEVAARGYSNVTLGPETGLLNKTGGWEIAGERCYGWHWVPVNPEYPEGEWKEVPYEPWLEVLEDGSAVFGNEAYTLTIDSTPISGVDFTLDDVAQTTPYSEDLLWGSYNISMPSVWTVGDTEYTFVGWEDGPTNATRTIELTDDRSLTATYAEAGEYTLTIDSTPITGVEFTLDFSNTTVETYATPFSVVLPTGSYIVEMPAEWTVDDIPYSFLRWEDASTDATRVIALSEDMTVNATYLKPAEYTLTIDSTPISDVDFTLAGESETTPFSETLLGGSYVVTMPSVWTVGEDVYDFYAWTDFVTSRQRTIMLTSNKSFTAMYIAGEERHALEINATVVGAIPSEPYTPLEGVDFTFDASAETTPFFSDLVKERTHVVQMPSECEVNETHYWFVRWNDTGSTNPTRLVDVTADMSLRAVYTNRSVHNIDTDTYYEKIEWAIGNATADDTIEVYPNVYYETLFVDKPLGLIGKEPYTTIIDGGEAWDPIIYVTADNVTISGFTLQNSSWTGIYAEGAPPSDFVTGCVFSNNIISNPLEDMGLWICEDNIISHNVLKTAELPMWLDTSHDNLIYGNTFTSSLGLWDAALSLWGSNNNTICGNTFSNNSVGGLALWDSYDNEIYHNNFLYNALTMTVRNATSSQENNGWISPSNAYFSDDAYANATAEEANVTYSGYGFVPIEYYWGTVQAHIIKVEVGIEAFCPDGDDYVQAQVSWDNGVNWTRLFSYTPPTSDSNTTVYLDVTDSRAWTWDELSDANFLVRIVKKTVDEENVTCVDWLPVRVTSVLHAYDDGDNAWNNSYPSGGNYWSDYTGVDKKIGPNQDIVQPFPDGIGDTPYPILDTGLDHYPLMIPWPMIFDVVWDGETYPVEIISNSTITALNFNQPEMQISFNVTGPKGTTGFCKVKIPKALLEAPPDEWTVLVDGSPVTPNVESKANCYILSFTYSHSTKTITIEGTIVVDNIPPMASAKLTEPRTVDEDIDPVNFDGSDSWDDIAIKDYTWTFEENGTPTILTGESVEHTFETPGFYLVTLEVTDLRDNSDTDTVLITVRDITDPVADASGTDATVNEDAPLTLDGSASSDNVGIVEYLWYVEDVPPQTLSGENRTYDGWANPGVYNVTLKVSDAAGNSDADTIWITVGDTTKPIADASETDTTVNEDTEATLDGTASSDNVGIVEYIWTFTDETLQTLEGNVTTYTFVTPGSYLVTLNVSDAAGNWDTDQVNMIVVDITGPTADAGPDQTVDEDILVIFNGSASLDNGPIDIVNYTWTFTDNEATQTLVGVVANYTFYMPGVYSVTLNVTDAEDNWDIDKVVITVLDITDPVANAGVDQTVDEGTLVTFDGSASTDNVGVKSCTWTFMDGGSMQILDGENAAYEFANPGIYSVTLRVTDAGGNWDTDTVVITVLDIFYPVADAGLNQTVDEDTLVMFDGSASTDNVGIERYNWTFMENGQLRALMGVSPNYIFVTPGVYVVNLTVMDAAGHSAVDEVQITVRDVTAPVANAGSDVAVDEGTEVTLDGSASSDNVGIVEYNWTFTDETLQTLEGNVANYTFNVHGVYVVTLNVTDAAGNWATDTVTISVLSDQTSTGSGSLPIWDIALVALAGVALALGIASFMRKGSKS